MWKKITIVVAVVITIKVIYNFLVRKMEEAEKKKSEKIPEDKPEVTMDKV